MNAIEHGNRGAPDLPVRVQVQALPKSIVVRVTDYGGGGGTTAGAEPNLDAKLGRRAVARGGGDYFSSRAWWTRCDLRTPVRATPWRW